MLEPLQLVFVLFAGFSAGFVDTIAGGGGIITVPALLAVGLPPHLALGTNKLQASFGSFTASWRYTRGGLVDPRTMVWGIAWTFVGAALGTLAILVISGEFLEWVIPFLLVGVFIYVLVNPATSEIRTQARMKENLFYLIFGLLIGFYDGFFGPGTGSFWTISFIALLGLPLKEATGHTKITNFTSNFVSLGVFVIGGQVVWSIGLIMGFSQVIGAWLGSHVVLNRSTKLIRGIFLTMVGLTILNILRQNLGIWV
ncbi:MAG: TSUP family transporter [Spirochaetales bacterium]|nr:TSUP family transporter [Spirochaetales bacterium]